MALCTGIAVTIVLVSAAVVMYWLAEAPVIEETYSGFYVRNGEQEKDR